LASLVPQRISSSTLLRPEPLVRHVFVLFVALLTRKTVLGVGCTLLVKAIDAHFRITDQIRLKWYAGWRHARGQQEWRSQNLLTACARRTVTSNEHGSIQLLVSPETALTSSLATHVVTIAPGSELGPQESRALECYYVLSGRGRASREGGGTTAKLRPGDCFVVNPSKIRWIGNSITHADDLVLLRSTDGGLCPLKEVIKRDPSVCLYPVGPKSKTKQ